MNRLLITVLWAFAQLTTTPRPYAGVHASTARTVSSWRYRGRHAATRTNRKRDTA